MSRSTARCTACRSPLLHHQQDGSVDVVVAAVARVRIDPTAHEGVNLVLTCRCGRVREWIVRERDASFGPAPEILVVH